MNDATSVRAFMPTTISQVNAAKVKQLYADVINMCCAVAKVGKYLYWWNTDVRGTTNNANNIQQVILRLRSQGFDIPYAENPDWLLINWRHPSEQICDARRLQYLSTSFTDHPEKDVADLLYKEVMIKCKAAATGAACAVVLSPTELIATEHQATLLMSGWEKMIERLKVEGFEVVCNDEPYCDIIIKW